MRVGIFGGTFNPIHTAHLIVAENLRESLGLERVLFIPAAVPPHKEAPAVSGRHRLNMVRAAIAGNPFFEVLDMEVARGGRSYSIDTLRELRRGRPGDELHFILGHDAFAEIASWKEAPALFGLASFVVVARPGHPASDPARCLPRGLTASFAGAPADGRTRIWDVSGGGRVILAETPLIDISSSDIRRRLREGRSVLYLVADGVGEYLRREGLYRKQAKEAE